MSKDQEFSWTVIVLTCQQKDSIYAFQRELELRQQRGSIPRDTLVLTVPDPQDGLGSGGATLNALLVATEHLSARAGYTVVSADVLNTAHILILHTGRDFPWDSCGRAFCWLPMERSSDRIQGPVCCLDLLLHYLSSQVCPGSPPGVWVCSTDMIITLPFNQGMLWENFSGVRALALPGDVSYAAHHGVYLSDQKGNVRKIIYRGTLEEIQEALQPDGKVPMVSGPVFFCRSVSEKLLQTHVLPPLDGCTYLGMDSGAPTLQISLFLDILMCLCSDMSEKEFMEGERPGCNSPAGTQGALVRNARSVLWRTLRGTPLSFVYVPGGCYDYLSLSGEEHIVRLISTGKESAVLSHIQDIRSVGADSRVLNCVLEGSVTVESGAVVQHCCLKGPLVVPSGCLLSGLELESFHLKQLELPNDIIIQMHRVQLDQKKLNVQTVFGTRDDLEASSDSSGATYLNQAWSSFCSSTGIQSSDLWAPGEQRCLASARLFPVHQRVEPPAGLEGVCWLLGGAGSLQQWRAAWRLSFREVLLLTDQKEELERREELFFKIGRRTATGILQGHSNHSLLPCFRAAVLGETQEQLLQTLDSVAAGSVDDLRVAARALASIAEVLGCLAGEGRGGLRSGPAANQTWMKAFAKLEAGDLPGGVQALASERANWLSRPDLLVRAARHYEGAGQVLLRQAVMSAQSFVLLGKQDVPPMDQWQEVECPARLDLAGGWSDTPPIAFEHGGSVTNLAVRVDGKRPIGARARRIKEPHLVLSAYSGASGAVVAVETICRSLEDLKDHCQPNAPGALLKTACVCSGVVSFPSAEGLQEQLEQRWGGGLEVHSWSLLPHGSGLGTSSILAGAVLAALYRCTGRSYTTDALIHAVLHLEQTLTTGGGWQDQVGGLVGGVKVARSKARLPLQVEVERLSPSQHFLDSLQQHLLLIYTGKTRLARNLLQDVVRSWYSRIPAVVENAQHLVDNAEECARACTAGSLSRLGACLERSWQQKKLMAPGCEPVAVRTMMEALRPLALGQTLAGAGGGGFLYLLTRQPGQGGTVQEVLRNTPGLGDFSVHSVEVDMGGLVFLGPK